MKFKIFFIVFIILVIGFVSGCVKEEKVDFETVEKGHYSGYKEVANYVINDEEKLAEIWNLVMETRKPFPDLPKIDFTKNSVVAVFMGEFPTGGYSIEIKEITEYKDRVIVKIDKKFPKPGSMLTQAFTQPYHIVKIKKIDKKIIFEENYGK